MAVHVEKKRRCAPGSGLLRTQYLAARREGFLAAPVGNLIRLASESVTGMGAYGEVFIRRLRSMGIRDRALDAASDRVPVSSRTPATKAKMVSGS
jgi:hypothetical protein